MQPTGVLGGWFSIVLGDGVVVVVNEGYASIGMRVHPTHFDVLTNMMGDLKA